jgi:hypothetical protein
MPRPAFIYALEVGKGTFYKSTAFPQTVYFSPEALAKDHLRLFVSKSVIPAPDEMLGELEYGRQLSASEITAYRKSSERLLRKRA